MPIESLGIFGVTRFQVSHPKAEMMKPEWGFKNAKSVVPTKGSGMHACVQVDR